MPGKTPSQKHFTEEEIKMITGAVQKPGLRYTVDLYLLDYIKHCLLEEGQLSGNIQKLQSVLAKVDDPEVKKNVGDVISSLQCVQTEYSEYLEDMKTLAGGDYPPPRGSGQAD